MPKTLLITFFFPPKMGGIEHSLANLCQRLPPEKIVVLADKENGWQEFDQKQNFKIYRAKFFGSKFLKPSWLFLFFKIWRIVKKEKIEVILFGHYAHYCLLGILFKKFLKIPFLIYGRGVDLLIDQQGKISKFFLKFNLKMANCVLTNSHYTEKEVVKLGIPERKIRVVYPGIDLEKFNPERVDLKVLEEIKNSLGLKEKKILISVGRMAKIKGFDLVIKTLPEIKKSINNVVYLIIGQGPEEKKLKELVRRLNLENEVIFVGAVKRPEEAIPYYFLADLYLGPSRVLTYSGYQHQESFGTSYLEAQAMGKPVVATRSGGIPEVVADQKTGFLVPPEDVEALRQAIVKILTDSNLMTKLKSQTRKWVERFSWRYQINLFIKTLKQVRYGK
ncbi:MAG: glycosyltransferase family 4 protein [Patescibacteria group bacterium]|nr:glycosyltransferase family 4 protein [Patescibacteria group bacterium]